MSSAKQRTTLSNLNEPQQMRELNRQLSWIWDQLLGGLNMKSLSSGTREIIESKADDEEIRSVISQTESEILQEVSKKAGTDEVKSLVQQTESEILQEVSKKAGADEVKSLVQQTESEILQEVSKKTSTDDVKSLIKQSEDEILLEVSGIKIGGTQMLRDSMKLIVGSTADTWRVSDASKASVYSHESGFYRIKLTDSGQTADTWTSISSPLHRLPDGWQGKEITLSAWIWSADWAGMDAGGQGPIAWSLCLSQGGTVRLNYGSKYSLIKPAEVSLAADAVSDARLQNGKWVRVSTTWTLNTANFSSGGGNFDANTHIFVQFFLRRNGEYRIYAPKLEFGNRATDWTLHPEEFQAGTAVRINKDEFEVTTPKFSVNIVSEDGETNALTINEDGASFRLATALNVTPRYSGAAVLYVDPNATGSQIAAGNYYRSLADALAKIDKKWVEKNVTINLAAGMTEYGTLSLTGVSGGGRITIQGSSADPARLIGRLNLHYSTSPVSIRYLNVDMTGTVGMTVEGCQAVTITNCIITGKGAGESYGIYSASGSCVTVSGCEIYDCNRSLYGIAGGVITGYSCKGNCRVGANRTTVYLHGSMPCDSTTWTAAVWAGQVITASDISVDQGSRPTVEPEPMTASYAMTASDSYVTGWSYFSDNDIRQGCINSASNRIRGCMWFDNAAIRSALAGKTIQQASLRLYAAGGVGRGAAVSVELYGTALEHDDRSSAPALTTSYGTIASVTPGEAAVITIPTQVVSDLVAGTINGLMVYSNDTELYKDRSYSKNYAKFAGETSGDGSTKPVLAVVYQ